MVIWLPTLIFVFALISDTALIFGGQARVLRVVQDANRAMSVGRVTTVQETQNLVMAGIRGLTPNAVVTTTMNTTTGLIMTNVVIPATDFTSVGLVDALLNIDVNVSAEHLSES